MLLAKAIVPAIKVKVKATVDVIEKTEDVVSTEIKDTIETATETIELLKEIDDGTLGKIADMAKEDLTELMEILKEE